MAIPAPEFVMAEIVRTIKLLHTIILGRFFWRKAGTIIATTW